MHRRVVITGMGLVTPLGCGVKKVWSNLVKGVSGITSVSRFDASAFKSRIAGQVSSEELSDYMPDIRKYSKMDTFVQYGVAAADEAVMDSFIFQKSIDRSRCGVVVGSGIGGLPSIEKNSIDLHNKVRKSVGPFFIPGSLINLVAGQISIRHNITGPVESMVSACATGANCIAQGVRIIKNDEADAVIVGGSESAMSKVGFSGFTAMRALSTNYNHAPEMASRPWDKDRDGFVISEGAGVMVIEEYDHAVKRGANIYGEILGYGISGDAYHIASPEPGGKGAISAMSQAIKSSGLSLSDISYINAHGTSTPLGDKIEIDAIKFLFGSEVSGIRVSSTKSSCGHMLGAAGSCEAIFTVLAIKNKIIPPTLNLDNVDPECEDINLVPHQSQDHAKIKSGITNSFGFGGTNVVLVISGI